MGAAAAPLAVDTLAPCLPQPPPLPANYFSQERLKKLRKEHGSKALGACTVEQAIGGMRGVPVRQGGAPAACGAGAAAGRRWQHPAWPAAVVPWMPPPLQAWGSLGWYWECLAWRLPTAAPAPCLPHAAAWLLPCLQAMLWETSLLDPEEGIRFRGYSIPELQVGGCCG